MSSILDSLKKLEKETLRPDPPPEKAGVHGDVSISKRTLGIVVGIFLCMGITGLIVYQRAMPGKETESLPAVSAAPEQKSAAASDDRKKSQASPGKTQDRLPAAAAKQTVEGSAGRPSLKNTGSRPTTEPMPPEGKTAESDIEIETKPAEGDKKISEEEAVATRGAPESEPLPSAMETGKADFSDDGPVKAPTPEKEPGPIDRLEGVGIKIQAISWSETPENSLAVINNQVLRAGDGIEGYQISRINPDDVVLRRGGKTYLLVFRSSGVP